MPGLDPHRNWLDPKALGTLLGKSDQTVIRWIKTGRFAATEYQDLGPGERPRYLVDPRAAELRCPQGPDSGNLGTRLRETAGGPDIEATDRLASGKSGVSVLWRAGDELQALRQELQETRRTLTDVRRERDRLLLQVEEQRLMGLHMAEALRERFRDRTPIVE